MKKEKTPYWQKLLDPRWQQKRLRILERDSFTCRNCGDTENTLHVHHCLYRKNAEPWDYSDHELWTFCEDCHKSEEQNREELLSLLSRCEPTTAIYNLVQAMRTVMDRDTWQLWDWFFTAEYPDLIQEAVRRKNEARTGEDYSI